MNANNLGTELPSSASISKLETFKIEIYPNQGHDFLTIRIKNNANGTIQIFSQQGVFIAETKINQGVTGIDISEFKVGLYFIVGITSAGVIQSQKFIIEDLSYKASL